MRKGKRKRQFLQHDHTCLKSLGEWKEKEAGFGGEGTRLVRLINRGDKRKNSMIPN